MMRGDSGSTYVAMEDMTWRDYVSSKKVLRAAIHITHRCNLCCAHCGPESAPSSPDSDPSYDNIEKVYRTLDAYGVRRLDLTGGEIFIRDDIFAIVNLVTSGNISSALISNGTLITDDVANRLAATSVHSIKVSLDGLEEMHDQSRGRGTFSKTMSAIVSMVSKGLRVKVLYTLYRNNVQDLPELAIRLSKLGVWRLGVRPCEAVGRATTKHVPNERDAWTAYRHILSVSDELRSDFIEWSLPNPYPSMRIWSNNTYGLVEESGRHITIMPDGTVLMDFCRGTSPDNVYGNAYSDDLLQIIHRVEEKAHSFIAARSRI